jgi:hypothetical protein
MLYLCKKNIMKDWLLNRIWEEMKQANTNMYYAEMVIDRQGKIAKYRDFAFVVFSAGGAGLFLVNVLFPVVASVIVAVVSMCMHYFRTYDVDRLCALHTESTVYFNRLQGLFTLLNFDEIDDKAALARFDALIEANAGNVAEISRVFGKINGRVAAKAQEKSSEFLKRVYGTPID